MPYIALRLARNHCKAVSCAGSYLRRENDDDERGLLSLCRRACTTRDCCGVGVPGTLSPSENLTHCAVSVLDLGVKNVFVAGIDEPANRIQ